MRLGFLAILVATAGCSGSADDPTKEGRPKDRKPAPTTEGRDSEGKRLDLAEFKGKVVLVDFWAGWCGPCMRLVPHERGLVNSLKGKPFVLLGVNADRDRDALKGVEQAKQINWRSIWDGPSGPVAQAWGVSSLPTLCVVDHEGMVCYRFEGVGPTTEAEVDAAIKELLKRVP